MDMFMRMLIGSFGLLILCPFLLAFIAYPVFAALGGFSSHVRNVKPNSGEGWKQVNLEEAAAQT